MIGARTPCDGVSPMRKLRIAAPALLLVLIAGCVPYSEPPPGYPGGPSSRRPPRHRPLPPPPRRPPPAPHVAEPRSSWTASAVVTDAVNVPGQSYVVVAGDTLRGIAEKTGAGSEAIARANRIEWPFVVRTGERLTIPGGRYHRVKRGESGIAIARAYGVPWRVIVDLNQLEEPYILREGQRIVLPTAASVQSMTLEQRAAAFTIDIDDIITGGEPAVADNAPAAPSGAQPVPPSSPIAEPKAFAGRFSWPLTGPLLRRFGPLGNGRVSEGINIAVPNGTPIRAAADGVVAYAGDAIAVFGGLILIKHGSGWITAYGHTDKILVTRGQKVRRGEIIARAGESGSVDQPQLHFEIRDKRKPVDPLKYLPKRS
jgi:murein DD-endopeptidase MepM/ murein hydrolase activator NlpD